ncbi:MAG: hypothetical protein A3F53_00505 [Candidatus Zambryskibacteria bacterium RIFCSPHIGHO2_12_FULL_48_10]|nr:MAG: hypothetical protein A3F53_00505 [Candidatus Zambryskibacteria bacterium RIFCSPHIGHO2_12_FULL_48_10]
MLVILVIYQLPVRVIKLNRFILIRPHLPTSAEEDSPVLALESLVRAVISETAPVAVMLFDKGSANAGETLAVNAVVTSFAEFILAAEDGSLAGRHIGEEVTTLPIQVLYARFIGWSGAVSRERGGEGVIRQSLDIARAYILFEIGNLVRSLHSD